MSATPRGPVVDPALREQAADWHVRLASDAVQEVDWLNFEAWLAGSPDHRRAFDQVDLLWSELDAVTAPATGAEVVRLRARSTRPRMVGWSAAAAAGLAIAVGLGVGVRLTAPRTQDYETARGERKTVRLADGSRLMLNGGTRLTVRLGRSQRDVSLAKGEAAFDVAKDVSRPFVIAVGDRQVRVVGTQFNVLRYAGTVVVTVRRGLVEVRPANDGASGPIARLPAGRRLSHQEGRATDMVSEADAQTAFAWTEGQLIFRNERLQDVAKVLDRYFETPLVVGDDVRDVRVTAVLAIDDEDVMVGKLAEFLPIKARRESGAIRIEPR